MCRKNNYVKCCLDSCNLKIVVLNKKFNDSGFLFILTSLDGKKFYLTPFQLLMVKILKR